MKLFKRRQRPEFKETNKYFYFDLEDTHLDKLLEGLERIKFIFDYNCENKMLFAYVWPES